MLMLIFNAGEERYAMECQSMLHVLQRCDLAPVSDLPREVIGLLNFHQTLVPIIDLSYLLTKNFSNDAFETRIILCSNSANDLLVGFIVEKLTQALNYEKADFYKSTVSFIKFPFLDGRMNTDEGDITLINPYELVDFCQTNLLNKGINKYL